MPGYRICSLDADGLIRHVRTERFETDEAAMAAAADLTRQFAVVEVWNSGRLLRSLRRDAGPSDGSGSHGQKRNRRADAVSRGAIDAGGHRLSRAAAVPAR